MTRENFVQKWSLGIEFDRNLNTLIESLENSYFVIKKDEQEVDHLEVNRGIYLISVDNCFGLRVDVDINDLEEGEYVWEINAFFDGKSVLYDTGVIDAVGKPTKKKAARPWDLLNPKTQYVDHEVADMRINLCKSCDMFMKGVCKSCGCYMPIKTKMTHASCPLGKWSEVHV
jgi:hypothetical protein